MNRLNQVNMSQTTRRFGLPQVVLLTGAFATAVLLAVVFRPARSPTVELASTVTAPATQTPPASAGSSHDAAQAQLAAAMARFANAPTKETETLAPATAPPPAVQAPAPIASPPVATPAAAAAPAPLLEAPAPLARVAEPQIAAPPAAAPAATPTSAPASSLPPLGDADLRRLGDKASQAIRDGDIYGARLILERTIEGGDANALLALAETYDPKALARMNVKSVKGDIARARTLYTQALGKGVAAARARLDALDR
jgi:hypothetical protein